MPAAAQPAHSAADSVERATYSTSQTVPEPSAVARAHHHLVLRADGIQTGIRVCRCLIDDLLRILNGRSGSVVDVGRADRRGSSIRQIPDVTGHRSLRR